MIAYAYITHLMTIQTISKYLAIHQEFVVDADVMIGSGTERDYGKSAHDVLLSLSE